MRPKKKRHEHQIVLFLIGIVSSINVTPSLAAEPAPSCDDDATLNVRNELLKDRRTSALYRATLSGDGEAALNLSSEIGKTRPDYVKCINRLGAENGDPISQHNYSRRLLDSKDEATRLRGMYWLKRAAAANDQTAKDLLAEYKSGKRK